MRVTLFFLAFIALVSSQQMPCPHTAYYTPFDGNVTVTDVPVGYVMNFKVARSKADGSLIAFNLTDNLNDFGVIPEGTYFYVRVMGIKSAEKANFSLQIGSTEDTTTSVAGGATFWRSGEAWSLLDSFNLNTVNPIIYARVIALCKDCAKTARFTVATALTTTNNSYTYSPIHLIPDRRSAIFRTNAVPTSTLGNWVMFHRFIDAPLPLDIFFDVTFPGMGDVNSKIVAYFNADVPPTTTEFLAVYPGVNESMISGNWLQEIPFHVNKSGDYYFGFYTLTTKTNSMADYTIKAGFQDYPCSMASGLLANIFLVALIPLTLFFNQL